MPEKNPKWYGRSGAFSSTKARNVPKREDGGIRRNPAESDEGALEGAAT